MEPNPTTDAPAGAPMGTEPMEPTTAQKAPTRRESEAQALQHLHTLLRSFKAAMLVTRCDDGTMRARPMAIAAVDMDNTLWFVTSQDTPKVSEVTRYDNVCVCCQDGQSKFITLSGTAEPVDDRQKLKQLWNDAWKVYFPQGLDTPTITLLRVVPKTGEYWDQSSLANKLRFFVESSKAFISGRSAEPSRLGDNEKVVLQH